MDTGSKISSAIGLILSGMGAGVTGAPNLALQQLNRAIDSDIESQKEDRSKTMNLWKMNREAYGSAVAADIASRNTYLTIAEAKAKQAMASVPGAQATVRIAPLLSEIQQKKELNNWKLSKLSGAPSGTEQAFINELEVMAKMDPAAHKEMEAKYIPGVGVARRAPPPDVIENIKAVKSLEGNVNKAIEFQQKTGPFGSLSSSQEGEVAKGIRQQILVEMNRLYDLNRITDIEYQNFKEQVPEIGVFRSQRALAQLDLLAKQIKNKQQLTNNAYAIAPFRVAPSDKQALEWAKLNPNNPTAQKVLAVNPLTQQVVK